MKRLKNKRGSFAVFAIMIFMALLICIYMIIDGAGQIAIGSTVKNYGLIWGKSILAEYDIELKEMYGIFGFYGDSFTIDEKLLKYETYSFENKSYIDYERPKSSLEAYSLIKPENLLNQIQLVAMENLVLNKEVTNEDEEHPMREIKNQWIIDGLPSKGKADSLYIVGIANKIKEGLTIESLIEDSLLNQYIFSYFGNYMASRDLKTYLKCEVEYIISGKAGDYQSQKYVENKLEILRNVLNLYYLYGCQEKRDGAMAIASAITPGAAAVLTQAVILEAWAYAEAKNDLKLLYDKKTVPLLKNDSNWALSIENVFNITEDGIEEIEIDEKKYVTPLKIEGEGYIAYLKILLSGVPKETKLFRIMDLIQINMKYIYCDYFALKDYYCGLSYDMEVNGINYEFEETYQ